MRGGVLLVLAALGLTACSGAGPTGEPAPGPSTAGGSTSAVPVATSPAASPEPGRGQPACAAAPDPPPKSRNGRWQRVPLPSRATRTGGGLLSVAAAGPRAAWAVGFAPDADPARPSHGLALGWDGLRWKIQPLPPGLDRVLQVAAVSDTEAWALGREFPLSGDVLGRSRVLRWDGRAWSDVRLSGADGVRVVGLDDQISSLAADLCGRVYLGGHDARGGFVVQRRGLGWELLPAPSSDERAGVNYLSIAPGSKVWAGVLHENGAEVQSWDGTAWHREKLLGGFNVSMDRLEAFTDRHVWYISNLPWVGGPIDRPPLANQVFAATLEAPSGSADPRSLNLPSISLLAGWDDAEWLYGYGGALAQQVDGRWVRRAHQLPDRFDAADLRAVPGSGQLWMVGARALTADDTLRKGTATVVRYLPR